MVSTSPASRSFEHKSWHKFEKGLCLYCGWHCEDCPKDVATCKCKPVITEKHADALLATENSGVEDSWLER
jgi:hypothetical protein